MTILYCTVVTDPYFAIGLPFATAGLAKEEAKRIAIRDNVAVRVVAFSVDLKACAIKDRLRSRIVEVVQV